MSTINNLNQTWLDTDIDSICVRLKNLVHHQHNVIEQLNEEVKYVTSSKYKDAELARLKEENQKLTEKLSQAFVLEDSEREKVNQWINERKVYGSTPIGQFVFKFTPYYTSYSISIEDLLSKETITIKK